MAPHHDIVGLFVQNGCTVFFLVFTRAGPASRGDLFKRMLQYSRIPLSVAAHIRIHANIHTHNCTIFYKVLCGDGRVTTVSKTTAPADKAAPAARITAWPTAQGAADKARLRGVEMLLLLDERVRVGEVAALRVARQLLATLLFLGANSGVVLGFGF